MRKYVIACIIELMSHWSFGQNETDVRSGLEYYPIYSIIEITSISDGKIKSVKNSENKTINIASVEFKELYGYPSIEEYWDGIYRAYHKNRFLAVHQNQYCLIDTNFNIVIDFSDTIVAVLIGAEVYDDFDQSDIFIRLHDQQIYGRDVVYQAIRDDFTFLYDNSGEQIFEHSYCGLLREFKLSWPQNYYLIRNFNSSKYGLIDTSGRVLLPLNFNELSRFSHWRELLSSDFYLGVSDSISGIYNAQSEEWIVFDTNFFWIEGICDLTYLFKVNSKFGIFEAQDGIILPAIYDTIILPPPTDGYCWGPQSEPLILKKGKRKKVWRIPKKYFRS